MAKIKTIGVLTSGGDAPGMNAAIRAVTRAAISHEFNVKGIYRGYRGLVENEIVDFHAEDVSNIIHRGGTILRTARCKEFMTPEGRQKAYDNMRKHDIDALVVIGGDGTLTGAKQFASEFDIPIVGIPGTIDNDLYGTDHCPGFGSAAKYIATSTKEIIRDAMGFSYKKKNVNIIEVMGRNAGWLTGAAGLSRSEDCEGPDLIYLPEVAFDIAGFVQTIKELLEKKDVIVAVVSEGIKTPEGKYVCEYTAGSSTTDAFGHIQMTGTASYLAQLVQSELGCKTRAIELSTLQRAAAHMASRVDVDEAFSVGGATIKAADEGSSGVMVVIDRVSDDPYQSTTHVFDVHRIANDEKVVPRKWINKAGNYVTEEFLDYVRPLIQGHYTPMMVEGLPRHLNVNMKDYDWVTDTKKKK
jgi:6-phosphofructokinase 1